MTTSKQLKKDIKNNETSETQKINETLSKKMWNEVKEKNIDVFAMVAKVSDYCEYLPIDDDKCFVICKATAALPALETALGNEFNVSLVDKYVLIEKKK